MDTKLKTDFKHCYGIKSLSYEFIFSATHKVYSIYAANGTMKTSFTKIFEDKALEKESDDYIFFDKNHDTKCSDIKLNGEDIDSSKIFVINSYNAKYDAGSANISTLLVNKKLKEDYEDIYQKIDEFKIDLLESIGHRFSKKNPTDIIEKIETEISKVFHNKEEDKFFIAITRIKSEINDDENPKYLDIEYANIFFNKKVTDFLGQGDIQKNISVYIEKYNSLLEQSEYFTKGIFNHYQAEEVANQLEKNGFFEAEHTVCLNDNKISTKEELITIINKEKQRILQDSELRKLFNKLDTQLKKNQDLRLFREFLLNNQFILPELQNLEAFQGKLIKDYLKENIEKFNELVERYDKGKDAIKLIVEQAKKESTDWEKVIEIYNDRFDVPYRLAIANKSGVILADDIPLLTFKYVDEDKNEQDIAKDKLIDNILSQGEKRAFYLLQIIFEIESRKKQGDEYFFIIDDIADSFDYNNKYAIIEYLKDMSEIDGFYQIILSHNFDFHRTVSSRLSMERANRLTVLKEGSCINLKKEKYQNPPFMHWKDNLNDNKYLIASIPFVRNLVEYSGDTNQFDELTSFLHMKQETYHCLIGDLKQALLDTSFLKNEDADKIQDCDKRYIELLEETAAKIITDETKELEDKIVLSIAIRLEVEKFILDKIDDDKFANEIAKNQTAKFIKKYKEKFSDDKKSINVLDKVQLMTPENIHINSFMYEPILDMSHKHLSYLYQKVKELR